MSVGKRGQIYGTEDYSFRGIIRLLGQFMAKNKREKRDFITLLSTKHILAILDQQN